MEDVLEVYQRPVDGKRSLVCLDEFAKNADTPSGKPGSPGKHNSEYVREGSVTGFMLAMPHLGTREVLITETGRRTAVDFALCLEHLAGLFPEAEKIVIVMDNLNTHNQASLYKAFAPEKARMLCERFEFHHTPAHGSWLDMAEIEIGLLVRACLDRRIEPAERMGSEVAAYLTRKNGNPSPIRWQFKNEDARIKPHSIYPSI